MPEGELSPRCRTVSNGHGEPSYRRVCRNLKKRQPVRVAGIGGLVSEFDNLRNEAEQFAAKEGEQELQDKFGGGQQGQQGQGQGQGYG